MISSPNNGAVIDVAEPQVGARDLLIQVLRAGICGTDVEFFTGHMAYLESGDAAFPLRIGHEWCGTVIGVEVKFVDIRWNTSGEGDSLDAIVTGKQIGRAHV